jgi:hypothetical protein
VAQKESGTCLAPLLSIHLVKEINQAIQENQISQV